MLIARLSNKLPVSAPDYWNAGRLRMMARRRRITCPACGNPVYFSAGSRVPHFAHFAACTVAYSEPESEGHIRGKLAVLRALKRMGLPGELEHFVPSTRQVADVWVASEPPIALEIQLSPISQEEFDSRKKLYDSEGITNYWYFGKAAAARISYELVVFQGEFVTVRARPVIFPDRYWFEVEIFVEGFVERRNNFEILFHQLEFIRGVPDGGGSIKGIVAEVRGVDARCKNIASNIRNLLKGRCADVLIKSWDEDRRGAKLYFKTTGQLLEYGKKLVAHGFTQARKPYLFYVKTDLGVVLVDFGGTKEVPIWEDNSGLIYPSEDFSGQDFEKRVTISTIQQELTVLSVPTRLSFYETSEPGGLFFGHHLPNA